MAIFTDAVKLHRCPKCGQQAGEQCLKPSGGKTWPPHRERVDAMTPAEKDASKVQVERW